MLLAHRVLGCLHRSLIAHGSLRRADQRSLRGSRPSFVFAHPAHVVPIVARSLRLVSSSSSITCPPHIRMRRLHREGMVQRAAKSGRKARLLAPALARFEKLDSTVLALQLWLMLISTAMNGRQVIVARPRPSRHAELGRSESCERAARQFNAAFFPPRRRAGLAMQNSAMGAAREPPIPMRQRRDARSPG